jgi:hypothetical protein
MEWKELSILGGEAEFRLTECEKRRFFVVRSL